MTMSNLRFLRFEDPHAYLEATKDHDDSFMNFGLGSLWDFLSGLPARQIPDISTHIFTIYQGDDLLIALLINKKNFAWMMSTPCSAGDKLSTDPELLAAAATLLATSVLATLTSPRDFDKIIGPLKPVEAFLTAWIALLAARGVPANILTRESMATHVSYATLASLPPPPAVASPYRVERAGPANLPSVAALYQDLQLTSPWRAIVSLEDAIRTLTRPSELGLVWVCRPEDATPNSPPVAFVTLGRVTPRTIAIRGVYVAPDHRRKGIAETVVSAVTRYFLGATPYGVHGVPDGPPQCGFKQEVNLNVADPSAEGVYRRSGFLLPVGTGENATGGVDPETGRRSWYSSVWKGVEVADPEPGAKA